MTPGGGHDEKICEGRTRSREDGLHRWAFEGPDALTHPRRAGQLEVFISDVDISLHKAKLSQETMKVR